MNARSSTLLPSILLAASIGITGLLELSCSDAHAGPGSAAPIADQPLAEYRRELLDLAFDTASALPAMPHLKNRSRMQESVVAACFELDQPQRALEYAGKIDNWRRGVAYAEYASYCARHGDSARAQTYLDLAREVCEKTEKDEIQDWQRDGVQAAIEAARASPGKGGGAGRLEAGAFDAHLKSVDEAVATGNFDLTRNALNQLARDFDSLYPEAGPRAQIKEKIQASWNKLPVLVRVELMIALAESALKHADSIKALELVQESVAMVGTSTWAPEDRIATMARLAGLRHRAGDDENARREADAALAAFDAERDRILDIHRAAALRPLAETYASMGDEAAARGVYTRALEEGVANPNSRPRAEDLSSTCCSMALHDLEPDAKLQARIREIRGQLGDPW